MTAREVELSGGAPWGFRMHGGADHNQPLRISRVNPGRKASLSGIREGDIISSINGRPTKSMSNAEAHAMLRSAGPVLRLGLNENRELSPRKRSLGKGSELKKPSQLIAEVHTGRATLQAPVYATIRPSQLPNHRPSSLSAQSSLNSLPAALNSTSLIKSVTANDETPRFHPTNPFYTTLPNYSSASKLPVPNGRASSIDRSKSRENTSSLNDQSSDMKSPSFFNKTYDSGSGSFHHSNFKDTGFTNGFETDVSKKGKENSESNIFSSNFSHQSVPSKGSGRNPFEPKRNSDPFEKYLRPENSMNGKGGYESSAMINSISDNSFHKKEEILKRSTISEHQINEVEEVTTIKKLILNGSGSGSDYEMKIKTKPFHSDVNGTSDFSSPNASRQHNPKVHNIPIYNETESPVSPNTKSEYETRKYETYQHSTTESQGAGTRIATESDDSENSGHDKTVDGGQRTRKYSDPKSRTINKVSKKILKAIERLTCNITRHKKAKKVAEPTPVKNAEGVSNALTGKPPARSPAPAQLSPQKRSTAQRNYRVEPKIKQPSTLRDICVQRIAVLPYGEKILEELATVSERLQNINKHKIAIDSTFVTTQEKKSSERMPYYPLPDVSAIEKVSLPVQFKEPNPPPRNSSLKKSQDDHWTGVPTNTEPVYICLSPSQKMLMEKTNTVLTKEDASHLVDMHKKYVDRRGYNEPSNKTNHSDFEKYYDPPIVPFKSQTGSRLLALIRDPSVTNNINSTSSKHYYSTDQIQERHSISSSHHRNDSRSNFNDITNNFKPIPPPRPKKYSSSFYESDESSDITDNSLRSFKSERKFFHYSTGNLSKDIENDISSIQNMHRYYTTVRDSNTDTPRRPSLPKDLCDQQMEYIRRKEKEVEAEISRLEQEKDNVSLPQKRGPKAPLISEKQSFPEKVSKNNNFYESKTKDFSSIQSEKRSGTKLSSVFSSSQEELLRDKMYSEYVNQMAQRQERKQHKIIKITNPSSTVNSNTVSKSMSELDVLDSKVNNRIEKEFISKARERWNKLGITDPETEDERDKDNGLYREPKVIEHKIKVIEGGEEKDVQKLPSHLQDFVNFTAKQKEQGQSGAGESGAPASPHVVIWCAVLVVVVAVVRYFLRMMRNL